MISLALIGAGQRGMAYGLYAVQSGRARIVAVAEIDPGRRADAARKLAVPEDGVYESGEMLLAQNKLADAVIIATPDQLHYGQAMAALQLGYDLLLEKPISPNPGECLRLEEKAREMNAHVVVCHVLRYAPFFRALKEIVEARELGRVISIVHNENVGNFHMAHSFVRGNWRNSRQSSPILLQKSCHDMDLLVWLIGSQAGMVSSFGQLTYFREENAPEKSTARCLDCPAAPNCRFDARKCYLPAAGSWPATVLTLDQSEAGLLQAIEQGPYGRCVYRCDNDVCDHQIVNIQFKSGVTAAFSLSAFTNRISRTIKIMCEHGEIRGSEHENRIEIIPFTSVAGGETKARLIFPSRSTGGHGGGDEGLMKDFLALMESRRGDPASAIARSMESHLITFAAEESRLTRQTMDMDAYRLALSAQKA